MNVTRNKDIAYFDLVLHHYIIANESYVSDDIRCLECFQMKRIIVILLKYRRVYYISYIYHSITFNGRKNA